MNGVSKVMAMVDEWMSCVAKQQCSAFVDAIDAN